MLHVTRLVVLALVLSRNGSATIREVEDVILRVLPSASGTVTTESPRALKEEVLASARMVNLFLSRVHGLPGCIEVDGDVLRARSVCVRALRKMCRSDVEWAWHSDSQLAVALRRVSGLLAGPSGYCE